MLREHKMGNVIFAKGMERRVRMLAGNVEEEMAAPLRRQDAMPSLKVPQTYERKGFPGLEEMLTQRMEDIWRPLPIREDVEGAESSSEEEEDPAALDHPHREWKVVGGKRKTPP